jgi:hypothetical protein
MKVAAWMSLCASASLLARHHRSLRCTSTQAMYRAHSRPKQRLAFEIHHIIVYAMKYYLWIQYVIIIIIIMTCTGRGDKPLVVDLALYNGDPMGVYRLIYLCDYVDKFIVVESLETFASASVKEKYYIDEKLPIFEKLKAEGRLLEVKVDSIPMDGFQPPKRSKLGNEDFIREMA